MTERSRLRELLARIDLDEDAFAKCAHSTPADLRRVADDWERMAPIISEEFIRQRKREGRELLQHIEAALASGDESRFCEFRRISVWKTLGIATQREIRQEVAARLGANEEYTDVMRCLLELMV